jgi:hypothetical protein
MLRNIHGQSKRFVAVVESYGTVSECREARMPIERVHSFLVHPAKHEEHQPEIKGTQIPRHGSLNTMLERVFDRASAECKIDIAFRTSVGTRRQNECRDLLVAYVSDPTIPNGRSIAHRLQAVSTHRSGLGLLFLLKGEVDRQQQLVIARFPADQGVIAEEHERHLSVEFVERVFMKSAKTYKSALYCSQSPSDDFWEGRAIDLQISGPRELSEYWIRDFLASDLRTTGPAGTMRLAIALRNSIRTADDATIRQELLSAAHLLPSRHGQRRSARTIVEQLGLSPVATTALESCFSHATLMDEVFEFDRDEFKKHAPYRAVELDNGALLVGEDSRFDEIFHPELLSPNERRMRFITEGRIIDENLRKTK